MLSELNDIRQITKDDLQVMEASVSKELAPPDIVDNKDSFKLCADFDNLYYEIYVFTDVYQFFSPLVWIHPRFR